MIRQRRGFTLIELLVVIVIMGVLVRIAIPRIQDLKERATAARLIGAIDVARNAAYQYLAATSTWPRTTGRGNIPRGLAPYLPGGFDFTQDDVKLAWQVFTVGGAQYGVIQAYPTVTTVCPKLYAALGGARNTNIVATCTGRRPRIDFYVDR
jgi:prepilin-type N-terminal cleavage/methylation domain-containing protein